MKALLVIDYTYDFVANDGALTCGKPGQLIERRICELTEQFVAAKDFVVMAVDAHQSNDPFHPETALFPPHNIIGTPGREPYGELNACYETHKASITWMDKSRYSAFRGTDLALQLRTRGIQEVHIVGVCTDICVLHTVIEALYEGFKVVVHQDAVASFNPVGHEWALGHFKNNLGVTLLENGRQI